MGIKHHNIATKYVDKLNNHLSKGSEEQCNDANLQKFYSKIIGSISQNRKIFKRCNVVTN